MASSSEHREGCGGGRPAVGSPGREPGAVRRVRCEARAGSAGAPAGAEHTASRGLRTSAHAPRSLGLPCSAGRERHEPSLQASGSPTSPVRRPRRPPPPLPPSDPQNYSGSRVERGPGAGAPRSRGGSRRPALHPRREHLEPPRGPPGHQSPKGPGASGTAMPSLPFLPCVPYLAGFVELLLQPRHRHRGGARPGGGWSLGSAGPRGHDARGERSPRAGLRRARLPRPRPQPLSHSHTRAHAAGNTACQSPRAAHWPSRGGMQMRPLGPPTLHCCVETRRTPDAAKTRLRSWARGGRRVPRAEPHAPRSGCAQDERHPAFHWPWVVGEGSPLQASGTCTSPAFTRGRHRLPLAHLGRFLL